MRVQVPGVKEVGAASPRHALDFCCMSQMQVVPADAALALE
jgi:hypothetical protein